VSPHIHTLTGAYALNSLDPDERADVDRHLDACQDCAREVAEFEATATLLGSAVAILPPARLLHSVLAAIGCTRQESACGLGVAGSNVARIRRRRRLTWSTSLVAAFALLASGASAVVAVDEHRAWYSTETQLGQAQSQYAPVARLLTAPDLRTSSDTFDGGSATLLSSKTIGGSVLVASNLPAPPAGRSYQAWGISSTGARSLGLFHLGSATVSARLADATMIGITVEPSGGSQKPTATPVLLFPVPA
jgi:anti-sigma-K factor RskA